MAWNEDLSDWTKQIYKNNYNLLINFYLRKEDFLWNQILKKLLLTHYYLL